MSAIIFISCCITMKRLIDDMSKVGYKLKQLLPRKPSPPLSQKLIRHVGLPFSMHAHGEPQVKRAALSSRCSPFIESKLLQVHPLL
ncbi:hypothetical protein CDAR_178201 [Caerostris darwini]|uniref:Uncharacterized protein n=1 Tax=Caerostris darwini TaxID=1538125 RepID=A0AAV4W268_9ARAC|nr:hypothetical protein CDAR_178201 [Caerostris darwini]